MSKLSIRKGLGAAILSALFLGSGAFASARTKAADPSASAPWQPAQLMTPQELVRELAHPNGKKPIIVCVGFQFLYEGAHIPGAVWEGPAREAAGVARLKQWAQSLPKDRPVIIYCGCCPFYRCPNVRPAFKALREVGLTHLRVLYVEQDFAKDWVEKGYPVQKGK